MLAPASPLLWCEQGAPSPPSSAASLGGYRKALAWGGCLPCCTVATSWSVMDGARTPTPVSVRSSHKERTRSYHITRRCAFCAVKGGRREHRRSLSGPLTARRLRLRTTELVQLLGTTFPFTLEQQGWPGGGALEATGTSLPEFAKTPLPSVAGGCGHRGCQAQMHSLRGGGGTAITPSRGVRPCGWGTGAPGVHTRSVTCFVFSVLMTETERTHT